MPHSSVELVTVVVPARNEVGQIAACLDSVLSQSWSELEVLVVDGDSDDATKDVVRDFAERDQRVRLLENPRRIIPVSLNLALGAARGRWLVRVDAHATVPPEYVRTIVGHLRTGRYGAVGGRKDGVGRTPAGQAIAAVMTSAFGVGGSTYHHGTALREVEHVPFGAYPVQLLTDLGGWDERLRVNQDFELDYRIRRAGHRILFDPAIRIDWQSRQDLPSLRRQYYRYGRGKVTVATLHPASLRPRHLAAPALVLTFVTAIGLSFRSRLAAAALLAPYTAALTAASFCTARTVPRTSARYVPAAFVSMHLSWGLGFWEGVLRALAAAILRRRRTVPSGV